MRILVILMAVCVTALGVFAQEATPGAAIDPATSAHVRFAHLSPDSPSVNVYLNGLPTTIEDLIYPTISPWIDLVGGIADISLVPSDNGSDAAVINPTSMNLPASTWTTVAVLGSRENGTLAIQAIEETTTELPPGTARLVFLHAVENGPQVNLLRDGIPYVTAMSFPNAYTVVEDAGMHSFQAATTGSTPTVLAELNDTDHIESYTYLIAVTGTDANDVELISAETDPAVYAVAAGRMDAPGTVINALFAANGIGDFASAFEQAGLADTLNGDGPFTVFAPAEFASANLGSIAPQELANLLRYHVVEDEIMSQELANGATLTTLNGSTLNVRVEGDRILVNDAEVIDVNIPAINGVVHIINGVLTPAPAVEATAQS